MVYLFVVGSVEFLRNFLNIVDGKLLLMWCYLDDLK